MSLLADKLDRLETRLNDAAQALQRIERAQRIDLAVRLARASDIAAATQAVEQIVRQRGIEDLPAAIDELRRQRPGLFRPSVQAPAMAAVSEPGAAPPTPTPGDRRSLMEYMRARRG
jgi:hypothetical protein